MFSNKILKRSLPQEIQNWKRINLNNDISLVKQRLFDFVHNLFNDDALLTLHLNIYQLRSDVHFVCTRLNLSGRKLRHDSFGLLEHVFTCCNELIAAFTFESTNKVNQVFSLWEKLKHTASILDMVFGEMYHGQCGYKYSRGKLDPQLDEPTSELLSILGLCFINTFLCQEIFEGGAGRLNITQYKQGSILAKALSDKFILDLEDRQLSTYDDFNQVKNIFATTKMDHMLYVENIVNLAISKSYKKWQDYDVCTFWENVNFGLLHIHGLDQQKLLSHSNCVFCLPGFDGSTDKFNELFNLITNENDRAINVFKSVLSSSSFALYSSDIEKSFEVFVNQSQSQFEQFKETSWKSVHNLFSKFIESFNGLLKLNNNFHQKYLSIFFTNFQAHFKKDFMFHFSHFIESDICSTNLDPILNVISELDDSQIFSLEQNINKRMNMLFLDNKDLNLMDKFVAFFTMSQLKDCQQYLSQLKAAFELQLKFIDSLNVSTVTNSTIVNYGHYTTTTFSTSELPFGNDLHPRVDMCLKSNIRILQKDPATTLPTIGSLNLPPEFMIPMKEFLSFIENKREPYDTVVWDVEKFKVELSYGDCILECGLLTAILLISFDEKMNVHECVKVVSDSGIYSYSNKNIELVVRRILTTLTKLNVLIKNDQNQWYVNENITGNIKIKI
ncbi:hypothetical protein DAMA08_022500 [Martiniozyma asiatica (nom. inval.)]|nr:hypothetical protein DAMA08_022500 [Martiniozyma asiatica]